MISAVSGVGLRELSPISTVTAWADATHVPAERLSNAAVAGAGTASSAATAAPVVAAIYELDGTVRRAVSLQLTADGRAGAAATAVHASEGVAA